MEAHEYQTLFDVEKDYWWFRSLRDVLRNACKQLGIGPNARLLDAGCGTGNTAVFLSQTVTPQVVGFDISEHAARFWPRRGLSHACRASINAIPFADASFDAVISVDVLECDAVDERPACRELARVLKTGGYLLLVVPAYRWLKSAEHHRAVHASRRYSKAGLRSLFEGLPLRVIRITHLFAIALPAVAAYRAVRFLDGDHGRQARSELKPLPGPVNRLLYGAMGWERRWLNLPQDLPFGSSLFLAAQKVA